MLTAEKLSQNCTGSAEERRTCNGEKQIPGGKDRKNGRALSIPSRERTPAGDPGFVREKQVLPLRLRSGAEGQLEKQRQIPFGNDRKKGKGNSKSKGKGNSKSKGNSQCRDLSTARSQKNANAPVEMTELYP